MLQSGIATWCDTEYTSNNAHMQAKFELYGYGLIGVIAEGTATKSVVRVTLL